MNSARYPKPSARSSAETDVCARADGGGNGWYASVVLGSRGEEGDGDETRSGEKVVHSDCTIFEIREI